jgi:murein DD-endopeptidase MepM/ murein hydrolase activator NlpD
MKLKTFGVFIFISLISLSQPVFALTAKKTSVQKNRYGFAVDGAESVKDTLSKEIPKMEEAQKSKLEEYNITDQEPVFAWPIENQGITTYFHDPNYYFRNRFPHPGLDMRTLKEGRPSSGLEIHAPEDGIVGRAYAKGRDYSYLVLLHGQGFSTVYGHLSKILVQEGDYVKKGEVVALSGGAPGTLGAGFVTTGPHLHFELRLNDIAVNPLLYLPEEKIIARK